MICLAYPLLQSNFYFFISKVKFRVILIFILSMCCASSRSNRTSRWCISWYLLKTKNVQKKNLRHKFDTPHSYNKSVYTS